MQARHSFVAAIACGAIACGSNSGASGGSGPVDSGGGGPALDASGSPSDSGDGAAPDAGPPLDHGAPSSTYPAFPPGFAQVKDQGGPVMQHPVVVAITWDADGSQASFDSFADTIGATNYWTKTTAEYGVGAAESGTANHVHIAGTPPATTDDATLQGMIAAYTASADAGAADAGDAGDAPWPAPTADTIYAFFLAPGTSLQTQSPTGSGTEDACAAGEGGYHDQIVLGSSTAAYAVVPSCTFPGSSNTAAQQTTLSMSHELIEASTDPQPENTPTYLGFDDPHFSFDYFQELQTEVGDACEFYQGSFFEEQETAPAFDAWVQRTWSNASALAGHDPCVPTPATPYFNVTPLDLEDVAVTIPSEATSLLPGLSPATKGFKAAAGASVTFAVGLYSDGPTGGPWTLSVAPGNPVLGSQSLIAQYNPSSVTATIDKTSGQNGEKAYVTVNVVSNGTLFDGEIVTITSTLGGVSHYMPVWIAKP